MRPARKTSRSVGGAFFQTEVLMPRMSRSSISNREPGPVSKARACSSDTAGKGLDVMAASLCGQGKFKGRRPRRIVDWRIGACPPGLQSPAGYDLRLVGDVEQGFGIANHGAIAGQDLVPVAPCRPCQ